MQRQAYDPSFAGILVNPYFLTRRSLASAMRRCAPHVRGRVLDVGCGQKPYMGMFAFTEYVGLEIDSPENRARKQADFFYGGGRFPFGDGEFDTVLCNQVLEHVFDPEIFVGELARMLRPGGALVLTVPFVWDEHEQPYDYARYSSFGLRHLLAKHGLVFSLHLKTCSDPSVILQLVNAYLYKVIRPRNKYINLLVTSLLMAPVTVIGLVLGRLLPGNSDLYLDNVVVARRETP